MPRGRRRGGSRRAAAPGRRGSAAPSGQTPRDAEQRQRAVPTLDARPARGRGVRAPGVIAASPPRSWRRHARARRARARARRAAIGHQSTRAPPGGKRRAQTRVIATPYAARGGCPPGNLGHPAISPPRSPGCGILRAMRPPRPRPLATWSRARSRAWRWCWSRARRSPRPARSRRSRRAVRSCGAAICRAGRLTSRRTPMARASSASRSTSWMRWRAGSA